MIIEKTDFEGLFIIAPRVFADERGFFLETFNAERYREQLGVTETFVQDNWSRSARGTLRGLHFQNPHAQGKLVWCAQGSVWDVVVDLRPGSSTRLRWMGVELTEANKKQLFVPKGFAHGFCVTSDVADFVYKCTETYRPADERSIRYNDPAIGITWPVERPILSKRDAEAPFLADQTFLP
jgi:dTDP-4-dehydrorhamnose 3,5-epimerase